MFSKPPPSSLSPKKHRWRPLYGIRPRPAALTLSVCLVCLHHLTLGSFSCFCADCTQQWSTQCSQAADLPEGHTGPRLGLGGRMIKGPVRAMSTNITPLSKRTQGPTAERLCYCNSEAVGSRQIANMAPNVGLSLNSTQDLKVESRPDSRLINQINH